MDPEIVERLNEQFREMTDILSQQNASMAAMVKNMQDQSGAVKKQVAATNASAGATDSLTKKQLAYQQAQEQRLEQERQANAVIQRFTKVLDFSRDAVYSLGSVVLDTNNNFQKYNQVIGSVGDAARDLGRNFGILGTVLGEVIKGFTFLLEKQLIQTDNLLSFNDQISRLGAANSFSTKTILEMAHKVGLTSGELDKLTKPIQGLGSAFKSIGQGATDSTNQFIKMTEVTDKVRNEFRILGFNDQERIEAQAQYIEQMAATGVALRGMEKSSTNLQKSSLEYVKNLQVLSEITGRTVEEQQKAQQMATANYEYQMYVQQTRQKIEETTDPEEKARLFKELEQAQVAVERIRALRGEEAALGFAQRLMGAPQTLGLAGQALAGTKADEDRMLEMVKRGTFEGQEVARAQEALRDKNIRMYDTEGGLGYGLLYSSELRELTGGLDTLTETNRIMGMNAQEIAADIKNRQEEAKAGKGESAEDPAQQTRNFLKEVIERPLALFMDNFLAFFNPLLGNTGAFAALAAGMGVATLALGKFALSATRAAASGIFTRLAGVAAAGTAGVAAAGTAGVAAAGTAGVAAAGTAGTAGVAAAGTASASKLGKLGGLAKSAGRVLGKLAWPLAAGMALYDAYQGFNADADASLGGKLLNAGKSALSGLTFGLLGSSPEEIAARKTNQTEGQSSVQDSGEHVEIQFDRSVEQFGQFITIFGRLVTASAKLVTASANVTKAFATSVKSFKDVVGSLNGPNARIGENSVISALNNLTSLLREKSPKSSARGLIGTPLDSEDDEDIADYIDRLKNSLKDTTSNLDFMREAEIKRHNFNEMSMRQFRMSLDEATKKLDLITGRRAGEDANSPGAPSGGDGAGSTENAEKAMQYFMSQGWTRNQAAGIVGNLQQESGANLNPRARNPGDAADGTDSVGIAQWNSSRLRNLERFARERGTSPEDFNTQLAFVQYELTQGEKKGVGRALRRTDDAAEAAALIDRRYEVSDGSTRSQRIANARALASPRPTENPNSLPGDGRGPTRAELASGIIKAQGKEARVDPRTAPAFQSVLNKMTEVGYRIHSLSGQVNRNIAGTNELSAHSRGWAIDVNPQQNPDTGRGGPLITDMPAEVVAEANRVGLGWGGHWKSKKDAMHYSAQRNEGGTLRAAQGGIFDGPTSGYPAELHGGEMVAPLDANSVLMKLAKTPADVTQPNALPTPTSIEKETIEKLVTGNQEMLDVMIRKLEDMVSAISDGNDVREKIFKNTVA